MRSHYNAPLYDDDGPQHIPDAAKTPFETYGETYFNMHFATNLTSLKRAMRFIEWPARRNLYMRGIYYNLLRTKYYNLALARQGI